MFCPNCGKEMNEGDKFCRGCGYSIQNNSAQNMATNVNTISQNEKILGAAAHLALMLGVIIASIVSEKSNLILTLLFFLIAPLIYYRARKSLAFASKHALQAFLWQTVFYVLAMLVSCFAEYHSTGDLMKDMNNKYILIASGVTVLIMLVAAVFMIYAAYKSLRGREYKYPFMPRDITKNQWTVVFVCLLFCVCGSIYLHSQNNYEEQLDKMMKGSQSSMEDTAREFKCSVGGEVYSGLRNKKIGLAIRNIEETDKIETSYMGTLRAQGVYRIINVVAKSFANERIEVGNIYLETDDGKIYGVDHNATGAILTQTTRTMNAFFINPDQTISSVHVFDIPRGKKIVNVVYESWETGDVKLPYYVKRER